MNASDPTADKPAAPTAIEDTMPHDPVTADDRMSLDQWWCDCGAANRSPRRRCRYCGRARDAEARVAPYGFIPVQYAAAIQEITTNGTTRKIPADEPVFLIRGQDIVGAAAVRAWANLAGAAGADPEIIRSAREHADKMDAWPKKKVADLP